MNSKLNYFKWMLLLMVTSYTSAQVGINTDDPKATLHVVGMPADASVFDGIIAPNISGDELAAKTYTTEQDGAIVYVTATPASMTGQLINVSGPGYYYFDGPNNVWKGFGGGAAAVSGQMIELIVPAEYAGGIVTDPNLSGSGTEASIGDICGNHNGTENIYEFATLESTDQILDVSLEIPIPDDFAEWPAAANLELSGSNAVILSVDGATAAGDGTDTVTLSGTNAPGDVLRVVVRMTASAGNKAEAGRITLTYNN